MERYTRWWKEGYLSSNGRCFDIGNTVSGALRQFTRTCNPFAGSVDPHTAGNRSLMRLSPIPLFFTSNPEEAIRMSAESSKTTHGAETCLDACRYFGGLIVGALQGNAKEQLLSENYGIAAIPDECRACIARRDLITSIADDLFAARRLSEN